MIGLLSLSDYSFQPDFSETESQLKQLALEPAVKGAESNQQQQKNPQIELEDENELPLVSQPPADETTKTAQTTSETSLHQLVLENELLDLQNQTKQYEVAELNWLLTFDYNLITTEYLPGFDQPGFEVKLSSQPIFHVAAAEAKQKREDGQFQTGWKNVVLDLSVYEEKIAELAAHNQESKLNLIFWSGDTIDDQSPTRVELKNLQLVTKNTAVLVNNCPANQIKFKKIPITVDLTHDGIYSTLTWHQPVFTSSIQDRPQLYEVTQADGNLNQIVFQDLWLTTLPEQESALLAFNLDQNISISLQAWLLTCP